MQNNNHSQTASLRCTGYAVKGLTLTLEKAKADWMTVDAIRNQLEADPGYKKAVSLQVARREAQIKSNKLREQLRAIN